MPKHRKIMDVAAVKEIEVTASWKQVGKRGATRAKNMNPTPPDQQERNYWYARRRLSHIINANFKHKDLFFTLTHSRKNISYDEAIKLLRKFLRDIRTIREKRNMPPLKYVVVTEKTFNEKKHYHHHIIMNRMSIEEVNDVWGDNGIVISSPLRPGEFTGLAHYLTKEPPIKNRKRWNQSKGLIIPKPKYEPLKPGDLTEAPIRTPRGYRKVYSKVAYYEEIGLYKYAKFVKNGEVDLSTGTDEVLEE